MQYLINNDLLRMSFMWCFRHGGIPHRQEVGSQAVLPLQSQFLADAVPVGVDGGLGQVHDACDFLGRLAVPDVRRNLDLGGAQSRVMPGQLVDKRGEDGFQVGLDGRHVPVEPFFQPHLFQLFQVGLDAEPHVHQDPVFQFLLILLPHLQQGFQGGVEFVEAFGLGPERLFRDFAFADRRLQFMVGRFQLGRARPDHLLQSYFVLFQFFIEGMLIQGDFNARPELPVFDGLVKESGGVEGFGLFYEGVVFMGGDEDDGDVSGLADLFGGGDAVDAAAELDVHEDEMRGEAAGLFHGLFAGLGGARHGVTHVGQGVGQVREDDGVVVDDQDADWGVLGHFHPHPVPLPQGRGDFNKSLSLTQQGTLMKTCPLLKKGLQ